MQKQEVQKQKRIRNLTVMIFYTISREPLFGKHEFIFDKCFKDKKYFVQIIDLH